MNATAQLYAYISPSPFSLASFPHRSFGSSHPDVARCPKPGCDGHLRLLRHVSFVDCPGHDILMATMLNGAAVMDAALLLVGACKLGCYVRVVGYFVYVLCVHTNALLDVLFFTRSSFPCRHILLWFSVSLSSPVGNAQPATSRARSRRLRSILLPLRL